MNALKGRGLQLGVLLGFVVVLIASTWVLWFSPWLRVSQVQISGAGGSARPQVEEVTNAVLQRPLIGLNTGKIKADLLQLGAVESVEVYRSWPNTVTVDVTERLPVGVAQVVGGQLEVLGGDGRVLAMMSALPPDLPELRVPQGGLQELTEAMSYLSRASLARIAWATISEDSILMGLRDDGGTVRWGAPTDNELKGTILDALLKASPDARWFDVSVAHAPVTGLGPPTRNSAGEIERPQPSPAASNPASPQAGNTTSDAGGETTLDGLVDPGAERSAPTLNP